MNVSKFLTTSAAALAVVGAGLVYAQVTTPAPEQDAQAQPTMPPPEGGAPTPSQDTLQRSDTPMAPDAQADRN